jgi:hypothetical protein
VRLSVKSSTGVADPRDMKRGISCPRQRNKSPGAPSFALFAKGGIPGILIPTVAYPTLCQERKGWGTRLFVVLPAVSNTNRGLIDNLFLFSRMKLMEPTKFNRKSGVAQWRDLQFLFPQVRSKLVRNPALMYRERDDQLIQRHRPFDRLC